jgi:DNA excision repair protein ERCC-2
LQPSPSAFAIADCGFTIDDLQVLAKSEIQKRKSRSAISVSVREMVEFVLRRGDLGGSGDFFAAARALEGTRGHQKLQKLRPDGYKPEVRLAHELHTPEFDLLVKGRVDGILHTPERLLIEEIKTIRGGWSQSADLLHWAQAKIYAWIFATQQQFTGKIEMQLTYLELDSGKVTEFQEVVALEDLRQFFDQVASGYLEWAARQHQWLAQRDESISGLAFPHAEYRPGQRALAVAAYRAIANGARLFAEAPTGIGKTISVLFAAIKALGEGHLEKIFFLTAKTTGRAIAEEAVALMRRSNLRLRSLTITARDKICFNNGLPCEAQSCPFAIGYYDRVKGAILDALSHDALTQPRIEEIARRHNVCPFELSLDVSLWVDVIICDYNYVFDPKVSLKRFFAEVGGDYAFLVDEAHNLVSRARDMFSAELTSEEIAATEKVIGDSLPTCKKALRKIRKAFREYQERATEQGDGVFAKRELPADILAVLGMFSKTAEGWLLLNAQTDFRADLLQLYFRCLGFLRTAELYDDRYTTIFEGDGEWATAKYAKYANGIAAKRRKKHEAWMVPMNTDGQRQRLRLFCLDPSRGIQRALERGKSAIFFSATLSPMEYYREILGGDLGDAALRLQSPFAQENLAVLLHDRVQTDFRGRASSYSDVAKGIGALIQSRPGNYLVFFPSYKYLEAVREQFQVEHPFTPVLTQTPSMPELERKAFIAAFQSDQSRPLVGFAVMGGVFGEGIDLVGDRLVGAVVIGVGLPQICVERDLISAYFQEKNGLGFEYAYVYPGLNRVIQAAGRVIRSETDRGVVLLMDSRFAQPRYQELLPHWWALRPVRTENEIAERATEFWEEKK